MSGLCNGFAPSFGVCFGHLIFHFFGAPSLFVVCALFDLVVAVNYALTFELISWPMLLLDECNQEEKEEQQEGEEEEQDEPGCERA